MSDNVRGAKKLKPDWESELHEGHYDEERQKVTGLSNPEMNIPVQTRVVVQHRKGCHMEEGVSVLGAA